MMKRILLSAVLAASTSLFSNAQETVVYNISDMFTANATLTETTMNFGDFVILNSGGDQMKVEKKAKTFSDGVEYTYTLKTMSKGNFNSETGLPTGNTLGFPVSGPGEVKVAVISNGSDTRNVGYCYVPTEGELEKGDTGLTAPASEYNIQTWNFQGSEGMLYFYSISKGINFYMLSYTPAGTTSLTGVADKQAAVSTEFYSINGVRTNAATPGIYLKREVMADGSTKTSKVVVR